MRARVGIAVLIGALAACSAQHEHDGDAAAGTGGGGDASGGRTVGAGGAAMQPAAAGGSRAHSMQPPGSATLDDAAMPSIEAGTKPDGPVATGSPDLDGDVVRCIDKAPPNSFEPDVQWSFSGYEGRDNSYVMPLVANLTDDNGDGRIDLHDIPDVVVVLFGASVSDARIVALDGATGALQFATQMGVRDDVTPALGDIDGDGLPEIVSITREQDWRVGNLVAFRHDGTLLWLGGEVTQPDLSVSFDMSCVALADMDGDGQVEILVGNALYDHTGTLQWKAATPPPMWSATTAADLDGDGKLEMVLGNAAYHHDGSEYFARHDLLPGYPQIADFDGDGSPEIALLSADGLHLLSHDGTSIATTAMNVGSMRPPAAVHDFDGDGTPELAIAGLSEFDVVRADGSIMWSAPVDDVSGWAVGTAFDFLADGTAEVVYGDEHKLSVFGDQGMVVYQGTRSSTTGIEYPVVADIDNDGSAEIVVVSNLNPADANRSPVVQAYRDKEERWIQARRIWNQHTYHVTNVYEDGRIPQHERPSWQLFNTFRTNAATEAGELCNADHVD
jgi:hypothetical protein